MSARRYDNVPVRFGVTFSVDGSVLEGDVVQRQYAVVSAEIVMTIEAGGDLYLRLHPDVVEYRDDGEVLEVLLPMLTAEWIQTPFVLSEEPRLRRACETEEIRVRVMTPTEERVFVASHLRSSRWRSHDPERWVPGATRDRLLVQVERDGFPSTHAAAMKVRTIREPIDDEHHVVRLDSLRLPERSTCVFCHAAHPETREHAVPNWATPAGSFGVTVASCERCNNGLASLESDIAVIARGAGELSDPERLLVGLWSVKTIWVLGKAIGQDLLGGSGDLIVHGLTGERSELPDDPPDLEITEIYSTIERSESQNFLKHTVSPEEEPWAMLRIASFITTVRLRFVTDP